MISDIAPEITPELPEQLGLQITPELPEQLAKSPEHPELTPPTAIV